MRNFLFLILFLSAASAFGQNRIYQRNIAELERIRVKAQIEQDIKLLEKCLDDEMYYTHSNGMVETKQQHLDAIADKKYEIKAFKISPVKYRKGKKMVVVHGDAHIEVVYKGKNIVFKSKYTAVYKKSNSQWRLAAWQNTKLK